MNSPMQVPLKPMKSTNLLSAMSPVEVIDETTEEELDEEPLEVLYTQEERGSIPLACLLSCLIGIGYLFPFSALTQPIDYWKMLFPDYNIEFSISAIYNYSNLVVLGLLVFFGGSPSFTPRMMTGFVGQFLTLAFVPTSYFLYLDESGNALCVLGATAFAALVTAMLDSSCIALVSKYPLRVQESFQIGVGVSTLIGSVYRDFTKAVFPPTQVVASSLLYFYAGAFTILLCILGYLLLMRLPISQRCVAQFRPKSGVAGSSHSQSKFMVSGGEGSSGSGAGETTALLEAGKKEGRWLSNSKENTLRSFSRGLSALPPSRGVILKKICLNGSCVLFLFFSTLALWPALITEIPSYQFHYLEASQWWSLILLTIFSFADVFGRYMTRNRLNLTRNNIWVPVLLRLGFIPLIVMCVKGVFFTHDFWSILFTTGLGFTNGYVGTLALVMVNECVEPHEQALAGAFTSFFLNAGLVLGASLGLYVEKVVVG